MTEQEVRNTFVSSAGFWLGAKQGDTRHKQIIDIYNTIKPLPRGYTVKYNDAWCATFVSAVAHNFNMGDLFPYECSCYYMVMKLIKMGCWVEQDDFVPSTGDLIFYDWKDNANFENTDNIGVPGHVGIVENVVDGKIVVIEGNTSKTVGKRTINVNGRYIRGFGHLDFSKLMTDNEYEFIQNWALTHELTTGTGWDANITKRDLMLILYQYNRKFGR